MTNDISKEQKQFIFLSTSALVRILGSTQYFVAKDVIQPSKIADKSFDEFSDVLKEHIESKTSVIAQRDKFDKLLKGRQKPGTNLSF